MSEQIINELKKENNQLKNDIEKYKMEINELNTKIKNFENIDENNMEFRLNNLKIIFFKFHNYYIKIF